MSGHVVRLGRAFGLCAIAACAGPDWDHATTKRPPVGALPSLLDAQSPLAKSCMEAGGRWLVGTCELPEIPSDMLACGRIGGKWRPPKCLIETRRACEALGAAWDGAEEESWLGLPSGGCDFYVRMRRRCEAIGLRWVTDEPGRGPWCTVHQSRTARIPGFELHRCRTYTATVSSEPAPSGW